MCDTFYLPSADRVYFGKNSDRKPTEPQALIIVPPRDASGAVRIRDLDTGLKDAGHAMALSCPTWMPGAEMGLNAAGVAIGNEAVFSKFKAAKDGVLGMDLLRAALMSASTALEALEALMALTERFDQGGNGSFKGELVYNNSYMIVGPDGAYVLETAAKRWAWKQLREPSAISNSYSIQDDYKRVDPATRKAIAVVNERMACLDEADAGRVSEKESWKAYVEDKFMSYFSAGDARRRAVMGLLDAASQAGGRAAALAVLRAHAAPDPEKPTRPRNVCNHDRDVVGSPTTGSMLVEYAPGGRTVLWFTGASYACSNVFKPILLEDGRFKPLWVDYDYAEGTVAGGEYWSTRRGKARRVQKNFKAADAFASKLAEIQTRVFDVVDALAPSASPGEFAKSAERVGAIVAEWDARTI